MSQTQLLERPYSTVALTTQALPFRVDVAKDSQDMRGALEMRARAYRRHGVYGAESLLSPEKEDLYEDSVVLVAKQKLDGRVIGTMRMQANFVRPMKFEEAVVLTPAQRGRAVELMRLAVENGSPGRMVTAALSKAVFEICRRCRIDHIFVGGRRPVDSIYRSYQFSDLLHGRTAEVSYAQPGLRHSFLHLPVLEAEVRWRDGNPGLYRFMALTDHPDIDIDYDEVHRRLGPHG